MPWWIWTGFLAVIVVLLLLDAGVLGRKQTHTSRAEASAFTAFWITLSLTFSVGVYYLYENGWGIIDLPDTRGKIATPAFLAGYLLEKSLAVGNVLVIALVFQIMKIPREFGRRLLFWGIFGIVLFRIIALLSGWVILQNFPWTAYLFGLIAIFTAIKVLITSSKSYVPSDNLFIAAAESNFKVSPVIDGDKFFTSLNGKKALTPLMLALILIVCADIVFALNSVPAIYSITTDPFLVWTANCFALLGLRSLFITLEGAIYSLKYLKGSLVFLLTIMGVKMMLVQEYSMPPLLSLGLIAGVLSVGIISSLLIAIREIDEASGGMGRAISLTYREGRRILTIVLGSTVLLAGIAMVVLPGPAIIVIPAGLAILGTEFVWARKLMKRLKKQGKSLMNVAGNNRS